MSDDEKELVFFDEPSQKASIIMARYVLAAVLRGDGVEHTRPADFLARYDDNQYTPDLAEIIKWATKEALEFDKAIKSEKSPKAKQAVERFQAIISKIDVVFDENNVPAIANEESVTSEVAELFGWMDESPNWAASPYEGYWHPIRVLSARARLDVEVEQISEALLLLQGSIERYQREHLQNLERVAEGKAPVFPEMRSADIDQQWVIGAMEAVNRLAEQAAKIGFPYRDSWWLKEHGPAALKGYSAQKHDTKRGKRGGAAAEADRHERHRLFMKIHAELSKRNPEWITTAPKSLAVKALDDARKKHPHEMGRAKSARTAVEYWDYIKTDTAMWAEYQELLQNK